MHRQLDSSESPPTIAHPPSLTKLAWLYELIFLSSASFAAESGAARKLVTQIGVNAVTIAASALCFATVSDLVLVTSIRTSSR